MFVDSHCHLHFIDYDKLQLTEEEVVDNAIKNDVQHILCVGTNFDQLPALIELKNKYSNVSIAAGLHPNEVINNPDDISTDVIVKSIEDVQNVQNVKNIQIVGIGETGLDYYWDNCKRDVQKKRFIAHINAAKILKKPLIVHVRDSKDDIIEILEKENASDVGGVIHCFTDDLDTALKYLDLGFFISFSGVISFPNAKMLREVVKSISLDKILIETDAPYLAPRPMRGKINQPAYVRYVAETIANVKDVSIDEVGLKTTKNYFDLFGQNEPN